jgi:uncharacterized protein
VGLHPKRAGRKLWGNERSEPEFREENNCKDPKYGCQRPAWLLDSGPRVAETDIDRPLVVGVMLFGVGWGLVGLCPGPALENLATLSPRVIVFVIAMGFGMALHDLWWKHPVATEQRDATFAAATDG